MGSQRVLLYVLATASALQAPARRRRLATSLAVNTLPEAPHAVSIDLGDGHEPLVLETGRLGRQADAAVIAKRGGTTVYTTLCVGSADGGGDFLPMSVEYQERYSSTGRTSGGYNKRDGRSNDKEILTCRLIDRPLRPTVVDGWCADLQLISWVLSYDGQYPADVLAVQAAAAALQLSTVPTLCDVGCARVVATADDDGAVAFTSDPTVEELGGVLPDRRRQRRRLRRHGRGRGRLRRRRRRRRGADAGDGRRGARRRGHRRLGGGPERLGAIPAKEAGDRVRPFPADLKAALAEAFADDVRGSVLALREGDMKAHRKKYEALDSKIVAFADERGYGKADARRAAKKLTEKCLGDVVRAEGTRSDGRATDEVRPIDVAMRPLPTAHGSAVFTRGETQSLATCTLGDNSMNLRNDDALDDAKPDKRFYLQYAPAVVRRRDGPRRRAGPPRGRPRRSRKALRAAMPDKDAFPYSVRVESLITESCGSSSMASVCGGCLALLDGGVPLRCSVAGVAMGVLLAEGEEPVVLTDILGVEDALGSMDFKVAGSAEGISAFQLDVKTLGLSAATLGDAMGQARAARLHVLSRWRTGHGRAATTLAPSVPRSKQLQVDPSFIGKIIGKGGATIKGLIDEFALSNIDVSEAGLVTVSGLDDEGVAGAVEAITALCVDDGKGGRGGGGGRGRPRYDGPMPEVDKTYAGSVVSIKNFGAFVEFDDFPGLEGLCHISELALERVRNIEKFIEVGDSFDVKVLAVDDDSKKLSLSRKAAIIDKQG
ncbi:polyribonucleotide nucleotidyltransferase [Aureococcus anophagefferens]|nr:polyribonucleotide nucleotidyltransferase [Aureococcus anophagefferens]